MREIKFRAWYHGEYHYDIENYRIVHNELSGNDGDIWDFSDWLEYADVEQYTGLKDKNGKEVYESDVVLFEGDNNPSIVAYSKLLPQFTVFNIMEGIEYIPSIDDYDMMIVVGNIHENPEVMNERD